MHYTDHGNSDFFMEPEKASFGSACSCDSTWVLLLEELVLFGLPLVESAGKYGGAWSLLLCFLNSCLTYAVMNSCSM